MILKQKIKIFYVIIIASFFIAHSSFAATTIGANISTSGNLTVDGNLQFTNGANTGYILQSDALGNATWLDVSTWDQNNADDLTVSTIFSGDISGAYNAITVTDLTITGEAQGDILYFSGSNWVKLAAGTSGQFLQTQGAGANPQWAAAAGSGDITDVGDIASGAAFTATAGNDGNSLWFEGTTSDGNEVQLTAADPGADVTVTIPASTGTLLLNTDIGTSVQAWDAQLDDVAGLTPTNNHTIIGDGANWQQVDTTNWDKDNTDDMSNALTSANIFVGNGANVATGVAMTGDVAIDNAGLTTVTDLTITGEAQGDVLFFNGSNWTKLAAGTSGQVLQTQGAGANPQWAAAAGAGDITDVGDIASGAAFTATAGNDGNSLWFEGTTSDGNEVQLTAADPGADVTVTIPASTGTLLLNTDIGISVQAWDAQLDDVSGLTPTNNHTIIGDGANWQQVDTTNWDKDNTDDMSNALTSANIFVGNGANVATGVAMTGDVAIDNAGLTTVTDLTITGEVQGDVLFFNGSNWTKLAAGTSGQVLQTQGAGANPQWAAAAGSGDITDVGDIASGAAFTATAGNDGNSLWFEGTTSDGNEIQLTAADPGADVTVTIPASTGTLLLNTDIGISVQAWDAQLDDVSGLTPTNNHTIIGDGANWQQVDTTNWDKDNTDDMSNALTSANIFVGNGANVATGVAMTGDVAIDNAGLTTVTDLTITGEVQGDVLFFNGSNWVRLATGTNGHFLQTQGAGANPQWAAAAGGSQNLFETFDAPAGTDPVADTTTDTLQLLTSGAGITITGNSGADSLDFTLAAGLQDVSGLAPTNNHTIIGDGANWQQVDTTNWDKDNTDDMSNALTSANIFVGNGANVATGVAMTGDVAIDNAGATTVTDLTITGEAQGDVLFFNGSNWTKLATGTNGHFLQTQGAGANPQWAAAAGGSQNLFETFDAPAGTDPVADTTTDTLQLLTSGTGITITGNSGTDSLDFTLTAGLQDVSGLAPTNNHTIIGDGANWQQVDTTNWDKDNTDDMSNALTSANIFVGNGANVATGVAMTGDVAIDNAGATTVTDLTITGEAQGDVLFFNGSNWTKLATGTNGHFLQTQGAGANPQWAAAGGSGYWSKAGTDLSPTTAGDDLLLNAGETLTISDISQGSILFAGASGLISQDNANLYWDDTTNRLGIGTSTVSYPLEVNGAIRTGQNGTDGQLRIYSEQGGTDYEIIFQPNAAMTQNTTYTLPASYPTVNNQSLTADTSGNMNWKNVSDLAGISIKVKSATQQVTGTTLANDNHLFFPIAANEIWTANYLLQVVSSSNGDDLVFQFAAPAGAVCKIEYMKLTSTSSASGLIDGCNTTAIIDTGTTEEPVYIYLTVANAGNAGTINFQWSSDSSGTITIDQYGTMQAFRASQ